MFMLIQWGSHIGFAMLGQNNLRQIVMVFAHWQPNSSIWCASNALATPGEIFSIQTAKSKLCTNRLQGFLSNGWTAKQQVVHMAYQNTLKHLLPIRHRPQRPHGCIQNANRPTVLLHGTRQTQPPLSGRISKAKNPFQNSAQLTRFERNWSRHSRIGGSDVKLSVNEWITLQKCTLHISWKQNPGSMKRCNAKQEMLSQSWTCRTVSSEISFQVCPVFETWNHKAAARLDRKRMTCSAKPIMLVCANKTRNQHSVSFTTSLQVIPNLAGFIHVQNSYCIVLHINIPTIYCCITPKLLLFWRHVLPHVFFPSCLHFVGLMKITTRGELLSKLLHQLPVTFTNEWPAPIPCSMITLIYGQRIPTVKVGLSL